MEAPAWARRQPSQPCEAATRHCSYPDPQKNWTEPPKKLRARPRCERRWVGVYLFVRCHRRRGREMVRTEPGIGRMGRFGRVVRWKGALRSHWGLVHLRSKIVDGKQVLGSGSLLQVYCVKVERWRVHDLCIWSLGSSSGHELLSSSINKRCTGRADEIVSSRTGTKVTSQLPISWVL